MILFAKEKTYNSTPKRPLSQEDFNRNLLEFYMTYPKFEVKVLQNNYGYILVPGMLLLNATKKDLDERAQLIYDAIIKINNEHTIKGWIVDLRINIGGNSNPMLAGLYHLLGNGTTNLTLDAQKNAKTLSYLEEGILYQNHKIMAQVQATKSPTPKIPVAVVTGLMTTSAGEVVSLGFRGRKNTIFIGEPSSGSTTFNDLFELPYNTKAAITLSYGADRTGKYTRNIPVSYTHLTLPTILLV